MTRFCFWGLLLFTLVAACTTQPDDEGKENPPVETDPCETGPCQNGGTCTSTATGYACSCATGYEGASCETNTDDCAPNPCLNGALCTDGVNAHTCACAPGFVGDECGVTSCVGLPDGSECDDSDACTSGETCQAETCTAETSVSCGCTPSVDCAATGFHYSSDPDPGFDPIADGPLIAIDSTGQPILLGDSFGITFEFPIIRSFDSVSFDLVGEDGSPLGATTAEVAFGNDGVEFDMPLQMSKAAGTLGPGGVSLHLAGRVGRYVQVTVAANKPVLAIQNLEFADPCRTAGSCNPASGSCEFVNAPDDQACGSFAGTCQAGICTDCGIFSQAECAGSCADLATDENNCGSCGSACVNGDSCHESACSGCTALGKTDCGDGACRDLSVDDFACGACGTVCPSGDACVANTCQSYPYPAGPYGTQVGDTIANLSFSGLTDSDHDGMVEDEASSTIALAKYLRVDGVRNTKALVITLSALWCGPCKLEEPQLVAWLNDYETWAPGRVKFVTLLSESGIGSPATASSMLTWAKMFDVPFDLGLDPSAQLLTQFVDSGQPLAYPFHILVRTEDMKIDQKSFGSDLTTLQPAIDAILAQAPDPLTKP